MTRTNRILLQAALTLALAIVGLNLGKSQEDL
jgi:hypothetical protein